MSSKVCRGGIPIEHNLAGELVELYRSGLSYVDVAAKKGVNPSTVKKYVGLSDITPRSTGKRLYPVDECFFDTLGPRQAYWLGFLQGDGHIADRSIQLALSSTDQSQVLAFKRDLNAAHPITQATRIETSGRESHSHRIAIGSKYMVRRLNALGLGSNKTFNSVLPNYLSDDLMRHWLRGLFDADGCARLFRGGRLMGVSFTGYRLLLFEIRDMLGREIGCSSVKVRRIQTKNPKFGTMEYSGSKDPLAIYKYMYSDAPLYLARKREKFEICMDERMRLYSEPRTLVN